MFKFILTITTIYLAVLMPACSGPGKDTTPVKISAIELHTAFMTDANAADKRFSGTTLLITGEVAIATSKTSGYTMSGSVEVPAKVYFRTELDYLKHDIKYVVCEGYFDVPKASGGFHMDSRIDVGRPLTVECKLAKLHWSSPGLYVSGCRVADL